MTDLVQLAVTKGQTENKLPEFRTGDTVDVYVRVKEGEKERLQVYKGVVLKMAGSGASRSFTVRKISEGIGVERTFPFNSPSIDRVEVIARGRRVRQSRLFYLRERKGRAAKVKSDIANISRSENKTAGTTQA